MKAHQDKSTTHENEASTSTAKSAQPEHPVGQINDHRPQAIQQQVVQQKANNSWPVQRQKAIGDNIFSSPLQTDQRKQQQLIKGETFQRVQNQPANVEPVPIQRVKTGIGNEEVTVDETSKQAETMAFLTPNSAGQKDAPVHLTKNVKRQGAVAKIQAGNLTHQILNQENSDDLNPHLTLTSGFMTAALTDSPIRTLLLKSQRVAHVWKYRNTTTNDLSQNKLLANQIVSAFNLDLDLPMGANFDNLMFVYSPGGSGPTFDQVVAFHDAVHNAMRATPAANVDEDPLFPSVSYGTMKAQITAGANALAQQWQNWTGGNAANRNDFRIPQDKWTDLSKAANILNRIKVKALRLGFRKGEQLITGEIKNQTIDANFFRQHLFGGQAGHQEVMTAIGDHLKAHNEHFVEELGGISPEAFLKEKLLNPDSVDMNNQANVTTLVRLILRNVKSEQLNEAAFGAGAELEKTTGETKPYVIWYDAIGPDEA